MKTAAAAACELLTLREVAMVLGVGKDYVYGRVHDGDLPTVQLGTERRSMLRIRRDDLDAFIAARTKAQP